MLVKKWDSLLATPISLYCNYSACQLLFEVFVDVHEVCRLKCSTKLSNQVQV